MLRRAALSAAIAADATRLARVEARLRTIESEGRMPTDDVVVKPIAAVRVAQMTATAASYAPEDIGPVISPLFEDLGRRVGKAGLSCTGPTIAYYEDSTADDDTVVVHATVPVTTSELGEQDGFAVVDLPALPAAATVVHRGSMDNVMPTVQTLARWIDGNGYRSAGHARELYLQCPDDVEQWVTELQQPIVPA